MLIRKSNKKKGGGTRRAVSVSSISVALVWVGNQQGAKSEIDYYADALWGQKTEDAAKLEVHWGGGGRATIIALTKKKQ